MNEFRIRFLRPAPWSRIEFVREDAHGNRDGDAFGIEIPFAKRSRHSENFTGQIRENPLAKRDSTEYDLRRISRNSELVPGTNATVGSPSAAATHGRTLGAKHRLPVAAGQETCDVACLQLPLGDQPCAPDGCCSRC